MPKDSVFNEYGVVNDLAVEKVDVIFAEEAEKLFADLANRGVSPIELRAVCQYLVGTIEVEMAHVLLKYQMDLHRTTKHVEAA